jgi:DNA-binding response OmpR family regulator
VSQRILVVEDDPSTRDLISQYLMENHFEVECAATGALAEASIRNQTVDLVLLDLNLPDQDGLMLARKLTGEHSVPVVILTGRSEEMDRVLGLELGADDYVTKPFSPRELLARVRAVLRRAKSRPSPRTQPLRLIASPVSSCAWAHANSSRRAASSSSSPGASSACSRRSSDHRSRS